MKALKYLNKYLWKYRLRLGLGVVFIIISNVFAIIPAQIIRVAFDVVKESLEQYQMLQGSTFQDEYYTVLSKVLLIFGGGVLLMALLKGVFLFLTRQTIIIMSRLVEYDLKNEIFSHYQNLSLSFYKRNNTGDLMNRISEDVSKVRMYLGPAIMYSLNVTFLFIMVITTMITVNPKLTLYVLAPLPVLSVSIYYVSAIINTRSERVQRQLSNLSTFVQEAFSGIRVLKSYGRVSDYTQNFKKETDFYKDKNLELVRVNALFQPLMILLIGLSTIITIYIGGELAMAGEITTGNIAEFVIYVNMLTWPVAALGWVTAITQRAAASQHRINAFLQITPDIRNGAIGSDQKEIKGDIRFEDVRFVYPDSGIRALKGVSFEIKAGESVALIGKTGSGKSTVADLVGRLFDASEGRVLVDGKDVRKHNLYSLRRAIGYVPQDVFLFSDSIAENIAFGLNEEAFDDARVLQAAKDANVYHNITEFPEKFDTELGERGITLSGGQKQRISIARAIIKEPRILIFDDSLSAVDTQTEDLILKKLKSVMKNKTTLIISHRVSTVKKCDRILVMDEGQIVEQGSHEELLRKHGVYSQLYNQQLVSA